MKQLSTKKWILSTLLFTALGSQYYFSVSSNSLSMIDLASRDPAQAVVFKPGEKPAADIRGPKDIAPLPKSDEAKKTEPVSNAERIKQLELQVEEAKAKAAELARIKELEAQLAEANKKATEAKASVPGCDGCEKITQEQADKARKTLEDFVKQTTGKDTPAKDTVAAKPEKKETTAQRQARERLEKAKAHKEDIEFRFNAETELIEIECKKNVACAAEKFSELLGQFSGDDAVSATLVQNRYNKLIGNALRANLAADLDKENTTKAITFMAGDIPEDYESLKENVQESVRVAITTRAATVHAKYALSEQQKKAGQADASYASFSWAVREQEKLKTNGGEYVSALYNGYTAVGDLPKMEFLRDTYIPQLNNAIMGVKTNSTNINSPNAQNPLLNRGRGPGTGNPQIQINDGKITPFTGNNILDGVQFGNPQRQGGNQRGGRTISQ